jgi:hypothetical protein
MILELPAPGMQDTRKTGEISADEAGIAGEAFEGFRRRLEHGLGGQPGMGKVMRKYGPGSAVGSGVGSHCRAYWC